MIRFGISPKALLFPAILLTGVVLLSACGSIRPGPVAASPNARLSPNPVKIWVAPFNTDTAGWLVGRQGHDLEVFKQDYQIKFQNILVERLQKVAPCEVRWLDNLPTEGWLVAGEFKTVYQGSRFLRTAVGLGAGETTLQTTVYVYDLSKSRDRYVLSFNTGVEESGKAGGSGSGQMPGAVVPVAGIATAGPNFGSGLTLDATRTAREIRNILLTYR